MEPRLEVSLDTDRPFVVGMLHCPPLPGAPRFGGDLESVERHVLTDAAALVHPSQTQGGESECRGVDGLMLENFGDVPFFAGRVPAETVAALTRVALRVRDAHPGVPLGINVLRNDVCSALAIAAAVGAAYVRVNILAGTAVTDQGVVTGQAAEAMRYRAALGASAVRVWADVDVKHAAPLAPRPLAEQVEELLDRAGADAVIVSGSGTGRPVDAKVLRTVCDAARGRPVVDGSGATADSAAGLLEAGARGLIVGSGFKPDGRIGAAVDPQRVSSLLQALAEAPGRDA